jgi:hypothetical protein
MDERTFLAIDPSGYVIGSPFSSAATRQSSCLRIRRDEYPRIPPPSAGCQSLVQIIRLKLSIPKASRYFFDQGLCDDVSEMSLTDRLAKVVSVSSV